MVLVTPEDPCYMAGMSKPMVFGGATDGSLLGRPMRETSIETIAEFFLRSAKDPADWLVGMEIEIFAHRKDDRAADYATMARVLESLGRRWNMQPEAESNGALMGLKGHGAIISLEPGGQIELASRPHSALRDLKNEVCAYVDKLRAAGQDEGVGFWAIGYQPFEDRDSMPKTPKARYDVMRAYFTALGGRGLDMMHLTASVQCALDFSDEKNLTEKIRTAARISPFLAALVAASPFTRGKPNGFKTVRYQVWLETDPARSGLWPEMTDAEGLTFRRYIQRALEVPPFFFMRDGRHALAEALPFSHYVKNGFQGTEVTVSDLVDHLTTMFPEIRPKGYVELRNTDCVAPKEAVAIAGFWRGILDDEAARREVEDRLAKMDHAALRALQPLVARLGLSAMSAVGSVAEIAEWLVELAHRRLVGSAPDCAECVEPLLERATEGRSPADVMLERAEKTSVKEAVAFAAAI